MIQSLPPLKYVEPAPFEPLPPITPAIKHLPVYTPLRHERRLTCSTHTHNAYINYYAPVAQHPTHCPYCPSPCTSSEYDSADVIVTTHQHFTRKAAITCMNHLRQINLARPNTKPYTIEEYLKMAGINTPSYPTTNSETRSACYLHSSCHSCGGTFTILYTTTPVQHTPPKHCVWCGSSDIYTVQADTEETCFITLSLHYSLPLALLKALYNIWHTSSHYQYFSQYMSSEPVIEITSKIERKAV